MRILIFIIVVLSFSVTHAVAQVNWSDISYNAYAQGETQGPSGPVSTDYDENTGPPLAVTASAIVTSGPYDVGGNSEVGSSIILLDSWAFSCGCLWYVGEAGGGFTGTYWSTHSGLEFSYNYTIDNMDYQDVWLRIDDLTTSESILYESLGSGSDIILADIPVGHEIEVELSAYVKSIATQTDELNSSSLSLTYGVNVAPEPISSALFIIGGTIMGLRRFRK